MNKYKIIIYLPLILPSWTFGQTPLVNDTRQNASEVIVQSPFIVTAEQEKGYRAENTLVGSRTSKSVLEIPGSVTIINRKLIDDLNAVEASQVLKFGVSGVTSNQVINDDVNIRGFRTGFSLRNGVTKLGFKRNPLYDVERIEVIKGPAAMMLGNNSFLGGAVNFVSAKPTHVRSGDAQIAFGPNEYVRFSANLMGPLMSANDVIADYRITVGALTGDRDKQIESQDQQFLGAGLALYFGKTTSIVVNGYYFKDDGYYYWEDFLDYSSTQGGTTVTPRTAMLNPRSTKSYSAGRKKNAFWDMTDSFVDVTLVTRLSSNANLRLYYFGNLLSERRRHIAGNVIKSDNKTVDRYDIPLISDYTSNNLQADFLYSRTLGSVVFDTTLGVDAAWTSLRQDVSETAMSDLNTETMDFSRDDAYFATSKPGAGLANDFQNGNKTTSFSYYAQQNITLFKDKLILVGGLRWFQPGGTNMNYKTNVVTNRPDKELKTHKYGIVYRPVSWASLYFTDAANAFAQTGFKDRFRPGDGLGGPLESQQGTLTEYGLKLDRQLSTRLYAYGSVAYYDMSLTNVRTFGVLPEGSPPGSTGVIQSAQDLAKGWEFEYGVRFQLQSGSVDVVGTYVKGSSKTAADPRVGAADFVPEKVSLMGKYTFSQGRLKGLMIGGTYFDQSRKRNSVYWVDYPETFNLFSQYRINDRWSVQGNWDNITDERYIAAVFSSALVQTVPGSSFSISARLRW